MLASYGKITFKVTEKEIKIFNDFSISKKARYVAHERINRKPLLQFVGFDAVTISFNMHIVNGVTGDITKDLKILNDMFKSGSSHSLFLGTKKLGNFVIESINEKYEMINNLGSIESVSLSLSIKEYVG